MDIITLLQNFVSGLLAAEENFYENPDRFDVFEKTVADLSGRTAADFLSMALSQADSMICESGLRKKNYNIHRHDGRTLITTVGDVTFTHTLFKSRGDGGFRYLLDDMMHLPGHERFSEHAEAKALLEAEAHSYQHAADSLNTGGQTVSKTAVMGKVHGICAELPPEPERDVKKQCEYLYIEADEDHIHAQKNRDGKSGMMGKLVYVFEGKHDVCGGRRELVSTHYLGGLYQGPGGNGRLWREVQEYIRRNYDGDALKRVYISGDGGAWIKAGVDYVDKSVLVADRFHLMKYINRASGCVPDDADGVKGEFYRSIRRNDPEGLEGLLERIRESCDGSDAAVEECGTYLRSNWDAIRRAFGDPNVIGCSAEGHVSSVLSERMSSRPMGWSETGSDRMCRLRCYVRNEGNDGVIDLVRYRREKEYEERHASATGTDGIISGSEPKRRYSRGQMESQKYFDVLQASIGGNTVRKTLAIRRHLNEL